MFVKKDKMMNVNIYFGQSIFKYQYIANYKSKVINIDEY